MKWFDVIELEKVKKMIDDGLGAKEIGDWYWGDFKNNAGTTLMAYLYALTTPNKKAINKLTSLLKPKGKPGPLDFNDVMTELYNSQSFRDFKKYIHILDENDIPFQIKSVDLIDVFSNEPDLDDILERKPNIVSKYMKKEDLAKLAKRKLNSNNYEDIVDAMSYKLSGALWNKVSAYRKNALRSVLYDTKDITNKELRKKYILEYVMNPPNGKNRIEHMYDTLLSLYQETDFTTDDLVDIFSEITWDNAGNGGPSKLLYTLHSEGKVDAVKKIIKVFKGNMFGHILNNIRTRPFAGGEKRFGPELEYTWILESYSEFLDEEVILDHMGQASDEEIVLFLEKFPDSTAKLFEKFPDKIPQQLKDMFIF